MSLGSRRLAGVVGTFILLAGVAACAEENEPSGNPPRTPSESPSPVEPLGLPGNALVLVTGTVEDGVPTFTESGSATTSIEQATYEDGAVDVVPGRNDELALRFPAFEKRDPYPRAVLAVTAQGATDELSPGTHDFLIGADFKLDQRSTGRADDNGNNLIQRGLSSDPSLYKLEVDKSMRPSCTLRGGSGTVTLRSDTTVVPDVWYRVRCERVGNSVVVSVGRIQSDGLVEPATRTLEGLIGPIVMDDRFTPISIGGKVAHNGQLIASATDQFNGLIMNPVAYIAP
ncbi:exported hypothetical protein [metagenome]|uniref:Lipoprotein n=1 Tax=metagenome TaxID=256318 RepID=A0A2P2C320_9ZZZZ